MIFSEPILYIRQYYWKQTDTLSNNQTRINLPTIAMEETFVRIQVRVFSLSLCWSKKQERKTRASWPLIELSRFGNVTLPIFEALLDGRKTSINYQHIVMTSVKQSWTGRLISQASRGFNACIITYPKAGRWTYMGRDNKQAGAELSFIKSP